jgi:7-cyano-7-deazaguanine reductase
MEIETFANPNPGRHAVIQHVAEEFTSVCPKTGHPDFGTIVLTYVAAEQCIELKALKLYLQSFRQRGIFYEAITSELFEAFWTLLSPRWMRLETIWRPHGGIRSNFYLEENACLQSPPPVPFFGLK